MNLFKPEDFAGHSNGDIYCDHRAASFANKILSDYLDKEGVRVYGWFDGDGACRFSELKIIGSDKGEASHTAILINIEPIVKERCSEHEVEVTGLGGSMTYKCRVCGIKLRPVFVGAE